MNHLAGMAASPAGLPAPDGELLLRARDGDNGAFGELVRRLARPALATAIRVLGDHALAEDAVQDAFARLWREAGRFDPARGSFPGWWRRMLMNCALDARRRLKPVQSLDLAAEVADPAQGPEDTAHNNGVAALVQTAAASLPHRQRAALALFYGEGLSMAEIADALGSSEKAVEGLLLRGRATLREKLEDLRGAER